MPNPYTINDTLGNPVDELNLIGLDTLGNAIFFKLLSAMPDESASGWSNHTAEPIKQTFTVEHGLAVDLNIGVSLTVALSCVETIGIIAATEAVTVTGSVSTDITHTDVTTTSAEITVPPNTEVSIWTASITGQYYTGTVASKGAAFRLQSVAMLAAASAGLAAGNLYWWQASSPDFTFAVTPSGKVFKVESGLYDAVQKAFPA